MSPPASAARPSREGLRRCRPGTRKWRSRGTRTAGAVPRKIPTDARQKRSDAKNVKRFLPAILEFAPPISGKPPVWPVFFTVLDVLDQRVLRGEQPFVLFLKSSRARQWVGTCDANHVRWVPTQQDSTWHLAQLEELPDFLQRAVDNDALRDLAKLLHDPLVARIP